MPHPAVRVATDCLALRRGGWARFGHGNLIKWQGAGLQSLVEHTLSVVLRNLNPVKSSHSSALKLLDGIMFDEKMFRSEVVACDGNVDEVIVLIKAMIHGSDHSEDAPDTDCQIDLNIDTDEYFNKQKGNFGR